MRKLLLFFIIVSVFIITNIAFSQELPQLIRNIPDPAEVLETKGQVYKNNWVYHGKSYNTYLYERPDKEEEFLKLYSELAEKEGYRVVNEVTDSFPSLKLTVPLMDDSALLFYDYQGYMLLMVPDSIPFSLNAESEKTQEIEAEAEPENNSYPMTPDEANKLGDRYANGDGVEQDFFEAVKYYRIAAEQGDPEGQCNLGVSYGRGNGVKKDDKEAFRLFKLAADQGYARGQYNVGVYYSNGYYVKLDYKEAMKWYKLAAEQNYSRAQYGIGLCYRYGRGVKQDDTEASKWFQLAAEQGLADAQNNLGVLYDNGQGVEKDHIEAVKWFRLAAEQGDDWAQNNLGRAYYSGEGVKQDYKEAVEWFTLSAEQGNELAQYNLSLCYYNGYGVRKDYNESAKWLLLSANQGHANAQNNLGYYYEHGLGVKLDLNEAVKWYQLAADQGHADAQKNLSNCLMNIAWSATKAPKTYSGYGVIDQKNDVGTLLRQTPSPSGGILRSILNGSKVKYLGDYKTLNGSTWVLIETQEGQQGWIPESSVKAAE